MEIHIFTALGSSENSEFTGQGFPDSFFQWKITSHIVLFLTTNHIQFLLQYGIDHANDVSISCFWVMSKGQMNKQKIFRLACINTTL